MAAAYPYQGVLKMRFMYIVTPAHPVPPTTELMEAVHKLAEREIKAGHLLDSGALMPRTLGAQVRITDGRLSVIDGPFVEAKEVIGGAGQGRGRRQGGRVHAGSQGSHAGLGRNVRGSRVCRTLRQGPAKRGW